MNKVRPAPEKRTAKKNTSAKQRYSAPRDKTGTGS